MPGLVILTRLFFGRQIKTPIERQSSKPCREGNTPPLYMVVLSQDLNQINQALLNGADVNNPYPENGNIPLHIAALNGYTEIVKLLLAQPNIDKTIKNKEGKTALDTAKERHRTEIVQLLS